MTIIIRIFVHILYVHPHIGTPRIVGSLRQLIAPILYFRPLLLDILHVFEAFFLFDGESSRNVPVFQYIAADMRQDGVGEITVIRSIFDHITKSSAGWLMLFLYAFEHNIISSSCGKAGYLARAVAEVTSCRSENVRYYGHA